MSDAILTLNAGSSSLKFGVYPDTTNAKYHDDTDASVPILRGKIAGIGCNPVLIARDKEGRAIAPAMLMQFNATASHDELIPLLLDGLNRHQYGFNITAAGHRVVHGGQHHTGPAKVTEQLMGELDALVPLAPLHQPHNLAAIRCVAKLIPGLSQIACFDTSFHRTQNQLAQWFALPRALTEAGIIRYGFHGLSYQYISEYLPALLGERSDGRVIIAHLGSGASLCAMNKRLSVATSTGFTALDGLMMGRRCGAIDPGVLLHLLVDRGMSVEQLGHLLYEESGLLGVSGISNDMAILQMSSEPAAREAIELFCYRAASELAALATSIDGLDAIVFTAGIGENSALVRRLICKRLKWMGVALDHDANERHATHIAATTSGVDVVIIPTDEEAVIARATQERLNL